MDTIAEDEEMKSPTGRRSRRQTIMSKDSDDNLLAPPAGSGRKQSVYNMGMSFKAMNVTRYNCFFIQYSLTTSCKNNPYFFNHKQPIFSLYFYTKCMILGYRRNFSIG